MNGFENPMRDSKVTEFKSQVELPTKIFSSFSSLSSSSPSSPHSHCHPHPHPHHPHHPHCHLDQIGAGCKLKMDDSGNILVKRVNTNRSINGKCEKFIDFDDDGDDRNGDDQQNDDQEDDVNI